MMRMAERATGNAHLIHIHQGNSLVGFMCLYLGLEAAFAVMSTSILGRGNLVCSFIQNEAKLQLSLSTAQHLHPGT